MRGTVWRRDSGEWEFRFEAGEDPLTGRRKRVTKSGFRTKRDALQEMRRAIASHEAGRSVGRDRRSVRSFLEEWHASVQHSLRPTTWASYRHYLTGYVYPIIGDTALQDLSAVRLNLLYSHLLEQGRVKRSGGLAPKTVRNLHVMLHRALKDAVRWDLVPRNAAEDASPPRVSRKRPTIWTPAQLGEFVDHVQGDRFYALWLLVVTTGVRRGELAGISRDDVDLARGTVTPGRTRVVVDGHAQDSETKTQAGERVLALDPVTWEALRGYTEFWGQERELLGQATRLLFVWPNGQPIHPDTITALFHKHCEAAGLPRIRLHDVRHSYASAALKANVSPKVISERLGHSAVAFTMQTYTHLIPGMDKDAADAVAELILGSAAKRDGRIFGRMGALESPLRSEEPADSSDNRRSAGPSIGSGGRI
jgi:integrase